MSAHSFRLSVAAYYGRVFGTRSLKTCLSTIRSSARCSPCIPTEGQATKRFHRTPRVSSFLPEIGQVVLEIVAFGEERPAAFLCEDSNEGVQIICCLLTS